jgi:hypothetical protein
MYELMYSSPTFHKTNEKLRDTYHLLFDKYHDYKVFINRNKLIDN